MTAHQLLTIGVGALCGLIACIMPDIFTIQLGLAGMVSAGLQLVGIYHEYY